LVVVLGTAYVSYTQIHRPFQEMVKDADLSTREYMALMRAISEAGMSIQDFEARLKAGTIRLEDWTEYGSITVSAIEKLIAAYDRLKKASSAVSPPPGGPTYTPPTTPTTPTTPTKPGVVCPYCGHPIALGHAPDCPMKYTPPPPPTPCQYCGRTEGHAPGCPYAEYVKMQEGGIVTRPTLALLGERGKEAVIPLDKEKAAGPTVWRIEVNVSGASSDHRDLARQIAREIISATEGRRRM